MQQILKVFTVLIGMGILCCGVGIGYYYGIFLPSEQKRIVQEKRIESANRDKQIFINKEKNVTCIEEARKYTKERWIKTCELVKEEANLRLRDCEKPSPITGTKIMSDEWCKATYEYREEAHGQCFGNKYGAGINSDFESYIQACNQKFPTE